MEHVSRIRSSTLTSDDVMSGQQRFMTSAPLTYTPAIMAREPRRGSVPLARPEQPLMLQERFPEQPAMLVTAGEQPLMIQDTQFTEQPLMIQDPQFTEQPFTNQSFTEPILIPDPQTVVIQDTNSLILQEQTFRSDATPIAAVRDL